MWRKFLMKQGSQYELDITVHSLHERLGVRATVRLSMALYNTLEEIDRAISALANVRRFFHERIALSDTLKIPHHQRFAGRLEPADLKAVVHPFVEMTGVDHCAGW